jgi:hypothetical protein
MENEQLIPVHKICVHYEIDLSFIDELRDSGLISLMTIDDTQFVDENQVADLERMIHLRYDLDVNVAGIDVISNLLQRLTVMQEEIIMLRNQLKRFS